MQNLGIADNVVDEVCRDRCLGCFRPRRHCYCAAIPRIDNQTEILILQHRRERFHPFNTARMVHRALRNSSLLVDHTRGLAARLVLRPRVGLLYPGPGAELLANVPVDQRPGQLVVIDGTWHHAKTLVRDLSALHDVPRYSIAPDEPSRYRIRQEPSAMLLSTVEATVAALRVLEPETRGLDQLLNAFCSMVECQLAHPKNKNGWRRNAARIRGGRNIPSALLGNLDHIVVAYGESVADHHDRKAATSVPVYWAAQRLGTGERFASAIQPPVPLQASILRHLELTEEHFARRAVAQRSAGSVGDVSASKRYSGSLQSQHRSTAGKNYESPRCLPGAQVCRFQSTQALQHAGRTCGRGGISDCPGGVSWPRRQASRKRRGLDQTPPPIENLRRFLNARHQMRKAPSAERCWEDPCGDTC